VAALIMTAVPASATPSKAAKMAQARAVSGQISQLRDRIEIANENYNEAASKHAVLLAQTRAAARRETKARRRIDVLQLHLGTRASDMYRTGPLGFLDVLLGAKSFDQLAATWDVLKDLNRDDSKSIAEMKVAKAEAAAAHKEFSTKEQASARQVAIMKSNLAAGRAHAASLQAKMNGIEAEIRAIDAAEEAAARAAASRGGGGGGDGGNWPNPTIPAHGSVLTYARSRLGCRYVWAGSGPRVFDCSGFTAWCYRQIGISLPHSSQAQINCGQRVSRANLQPGDLVFFGSPIHHVGMYIGGGMMIHAPHSGDVVKIAPAFRSNYVGACRP
jgi:peptidoglycan DL-endopeptidase CwlO